MAAKTVKYQYNQSNLAASLARLITWVENGCLSKSALADLWENFDIALSHTQESNDDCFGTEGYGKSIFGRE